MVSHTAIVLHDDESRLPGDLALPDPCHGVVLFAHGSGSSRLSPRNQMVAAALHGHGLGTVLFDLLTAEEDQVYTNRFDIELLARRLGMATVWATGQRSIHALPLGYFGASTGAAAALLAAGTTAVETVRAVVSRGGRPDLAGAALGKVRAPTLLIVGGEDQDVLALNRTAYAALHCQRELSIVPGATHLFEEPGALQIVAERAAAWFLRWFAGDGWVISPR